MPMEEMALLAAKDASWVDTDAAELKQRITVRICSDAHTRT